MDQKSEESLEHVVRVLGEYSRTVLEKPSRDYVSGTYTPSRSLVDGYVYGILRIFCKKDDRQYARFHALYDKIRDGMIPAFPDGPDHSRQFKIPFTKE